jgi:hypothetical protein
MPIDLIFDHMEEDTIFLKSPAQDSKLRSIKTNLYDLTYLGTLRPADKGLPYFLFSGKPCQNCLDDRAIFSVRPNGEKHNSFVFPGKIIDPKTKALVLESRAFFGKCLPRKGDVYVVFQREKIDRRRFLQPSVFIAEAASDHLEEVLLERRLPSIRTTLQMVKKGSCREVQGRNRVMLSIPLDLHPKNNSDNEDDDENDDEKEKSKPVDL